MPLKALLRFYKITGSNCSVHGCPKSRNKTKKDEKKGCNIHAKDKML